MASNHTKAIRQAEAHRPESCLFAGTIELHDLEAKEGDKVPRFSIQAYNGGPLSVAGFKYPVVVELASAKFERDQTAINRNHEQNRELGHTTNQKITAEGIYLEGLLSVPGPDRDAVIEAARSGKRWDASIEATFPPPQFIPMGKTVFLNGQTFSGPVYAARKAVITGTAILNKGADRSSVVSIAAQKKASSKMDESLRSYIEAQGFDPDTLSDNQVAYFKAQHKETPAPVKPAPSDDADAIARMRQLMAAEHERIADINRLCAQYGNPTVKEGDKEISLAAKAIGDPGISLTEVEYKCKIAKLEKDSAGGPNGQFAIHASERANATPMVLEAAFSQTVGMPDVEKDFDEKTLDAAHKHYRGFGLQQLILQAAAMNGYHCRPGERIGQGNFMEVLNYAIPPRTLQASGFSTVSLPGIISNVANKSILMGYMEEDQVWREISEIGSNSNFFAHTRYRLLDDMEYEELPPDGFIKHGRVGEENYTTQVKTNAKMFALTRVMIINDDISAFADIRARLGRGAAKKFNKVFWTEFMDNSSFFTTALTNYIEGSTTNLGLDGVGLKLGVTQIRKMTTPAADGTKHIGASVRPTKLLVPPELESIADTLYTATNISAVKASDGNIYANKYRPIVAWQLSDTGYSGNSTTAWYLFGDGLKPMAVSFLNGVQAPTVESADTDFNTLGIQFRGYHDFGADKSEYLAGLKSKGAT